MFDLSGAFNNILGRAAGLGITNTEASGDECHERSQQTMHIRNHAFSVST